MPDNKICPSWVEELNKIIGEISKEQEGEEEDE